MAGEDSSSAYCKTGSPRFGWLCLARSALALVVTVLAVIVLVLGLGLVLHAGTTIIELNVAQSDVFVYSSTKDTDYEIRFYLEANNPSEFLFISYQNITVNLFKDRKPLAMFDLYPSSLILWPKEEQEFFVYALVDDHGFTAEAKDMLFKKEEKIDGAVMALSGELSVRTTQRGAATASRATNFSCIPVTVKGNGELPKPSSENYRADCVMGA